MARLSQKENFIRVITGQTPDYLPINRFAPGATPLMTMADSSVLGDFRGPNGGRDPWGVPFTTNDPFGYAAAIPKPNDFILTDVTKWRDVIKMPNYDDVDWELAAKRDREKFCTNPETMFVIGGYADFFQQFIGMMGFTEGLLAFFEEPDEVKALFDFMLEHNKYISKNIVEYYKPEGYYLLDDSATRLRPFISPEMFKEFLVPRYNECFSYAKEANIPIFYHNCGRCEDFIPAMVEIGIIEWDPAQVENDLAHIKATLGDKLTINGGYQFRVTEKWPNVTEEEVRQSVRDTINTLGKGGRYIFSGSVFGNSDPKDPMVATVNGWITDEALKLSETIYK